MTTITIDRAIVEQVLEVLVRASSHYDTYAEIDALRAALAQQAEPVAAVAENATTQQRVSETPPSDYRRGYWDGFNIGKREGRIEAEAALADHIGEANEVVYQISMKDGAASSAWVDVDEPTYRSAKLYGEYKCRCLYTAPPQKPVNLQDIEQYQLQMDGICAAALGYWTEDNSIHPDYDTPALRDVAKLYAKYAALYAGQSQRKPLTDEQIDALELPLSGTGTVRDLVRVIERAHGIGGSNG